MQVLKYYGVSRGTIQRAVRDLVDQGLLRRERDRGRLQLAPQIARVRQRLN